MKKSYKKLFAFIILLIILFSAGCFRAPDFDSKLSSIVEQHRFSIAGWEIKTLLTDLNRAKSVQATVDGLGKANEYFSLVEQTITIKQEITAIEIGRKQGDLSRLQAELAVLEERTAALKDIAERVIREEIKETLAELGILNPFADFMKLETLFPPLVFKLEKPPSLLVVSPRDRIESMREILLRQDTNTETKESIEEQVDALGVSSLVVELGGLGAVYPAIVHPESNARFAIDAAVEEWLHQYLLFKPLGFLYLLDLIGVSQNYEIATMNETLASMVSREIGSMIFEKYYSTGGKDDSPSKKAESDSDFNREMRQIRRTVDDLLAQGKIEQAEQFMEARRQYLARKGYYIRKLNQAYFAFYGAYADDPAFISPIGLEMMELRKQSPSLKDFLEKAASMTSREQLKRAVGGSGIVYFPPRSSITLPPISSSFCVPL